MVDEAELLQVVNIPEVPKSLPARKYKKKLLSRVGEFKIYRHIPLRAKKMPSSAYQGNEVPLPPKIVRN